MITYKKLESLIYGLEKDWLQRLRSKAKPSDFDTRLINGETQFFAIDNSSKSYADKPDKLRPVVVAIGINYYQRSLEGYHLPEFFNLDCQNKWGGITVTRDTQMVPGVIQAFSDYKNNKRIWAEMCLAAKDNLSPSNDFHLVATNLLPFITHDSWSQLPVPLRTKLMADSFAFFKREFGSAIKFIEDLYQVLKGPITIGHGYSPEIMSAFDLMKPLCKHFWHEWIYYANLGRPYNPTTKIWDKEIPLDKGPIVRGRFQTDSGDC